MSTVCICGDLWEWRSRHRRRSWWGSEKGRSPESRCHEYQLSIHEPGLLSRQCTCLFQNGQSIGVAKSPCQVFFYVFSIAPVQRVRYKRGGGRAHGECPAADDGTTARETERTQKRYTPYRYRAVKY